MNSISRLLVAENVRVGMAVTSKKRLFEQVGLMFEESDGIERDKVFDSLFARERLGSTGLGEGVAIPHGRIKGLKEPRAAVVRLETALPFDAPDGEPVKLLVILLVPENANEQHLEILSELAELLSDEDTRQSMMTEQDSGEIHQALSNWAPYRPAA
jgi:PTS system nitrogen regulatory IIA component